MAGVSKLVGKEVLEKAEAALRECGKRDDVSWKLKAIVAIEKFTVTHVAATFGVSRLAVTKWVHAFVAEGVDGLKLKPGRGRKSLLTLEEQGQVKLWLINDPNLTIQAVQAKIATTFNKTLQKSATHSLMRRLGLSYITPRPVHHKQDKDQQEVFKKKSARKSKKPSP